jgi:predicted esterase
MDTQQFAPPEAYVSISRQEVFLSKNTLARYFEAWKNRIAGRNSEELPVKPTLKIIGGGFSFQGAQIGGEFLLENDAVFQDLLRFSGLQRALDAIGGMVRLDMEAGETEISEEGLRLTLLVE